MKIHIERHSEVPQTPRVLQVQGMFDLPAGCERPAQSWDVHMPIEGVEWTIGLIVGPSGCGKSTIARELWGAELERNAALQHAWDPNKSLLDSFPKELSIQDITSLLSSVGFSSPPSWIKPFHVLSNGEQFRVMMARSLAEAKVSGGIAVIDEFTSVVDRTAAKVGSFAAAKAARRFGIKLVAITCHDDVEQWLLPDWTYRPVECRWERGSLQRRPPIQLHLYRTSSAAWRYFKHHHYLTGEINKAATCWVAFADLGEGPRLAAFFAWLPFFGRLKDSRHAKRGHRTVCLPDFQGLGIGDHVGRITASMWKALGFRTFSTSGHPAVMHMRLRARGEDGKPLYKINQMPSFTARGKHTVDRTRATNRKIATFEYIGPSMPIEQAKALHEGPWINL